jgi:hypothetical protein
VAIQVLTKPDTEGRLLGMIKTVAGYARESGALDASRIDAMLRTVDRSLAEGTYLAITPQFIVTATPWTAACSESGRHIGSTMQFTGNLARLQQLPLGPQSVLLDVENDDIRAAAAQLIPAGTGS